MVFTGQGSPAGVGGLFRANWYAVPMGDHCQLLMATTGCVGRGRWHSGPCEDMKTTGDWLRPGLRPWRPIADLDPCRMGAQQALGRHDGRRTR